MSDEPDQTPEEDLRWFAERIISGEFQALTIVMIDEKNVTHTFADCNLVTAIGLSEWAAHWWKSKLYESD